MPGTRIALGRLAPPAVLLAVACALAAPAAAPAAGPTDAACFGAASRDPQRPCLNPLLSGVVVPTPAAARVVPNPDCRVEYRSRALFVCGWGAPRATATRTFALIGDSHAAHWRPALEALARHRTWRAVSMSRAGCPLTTAFAKLPTVARSKACARWNRAVRRWLARHPEVTVVFVAQHRISVVPRKGQSAGRARATGYRRAWRALLNRHVRHVIVLRDTPRDTPQTQACITAALAAGRPAGPACAVPRRYAVPRDPAAETARALRNPRVQVADFTDVFCSSRLCLPVIGGALVHRDTQHMTRQFVASLGPLMIAMVDRLSARWRDPSQRVDDTRQDDATPGPYGIVRPPARG